MTNTQTLEDQVAGTQFTINGKPLFNSSQSVSGDIDDTLDMDWVKSAFMLSDDGLTDFFDLKNRYWTSAGGKFTDGRFGCNIGVNCHSQFTPYADIPEPGRMAGRVPVTLSETNGDYGMGGLWSSAFDDPEQIIYLQFGVPEFNNLLSFFGGSFNHGASVLARTGKWPSFLYDTMTFLGRSLMLAAFPLITLPILIYEVADFFFFRKSAKFYHMKETMFLYWGAVNMIVNTLALNSGIYPKVLNANPGASNRIGMPFTLDQETLDIYHELAPDIFSKENYIDVFAFANRAQRLANQLLHDEFQALNQGTATDMYGYVKKNIVGNGRHRTIASNAHGNVGVATFTHWVSTMFSEWGEFNNAENEASVNVNDPRGTFTSEPGKDKEKEPYNPLFSSSSLNNFKKMQNAKFRQADQFAIFRVAHTGSQSESFSNSVQASALEGKLNSTSSSFAEHRFTIGDGAALGSIVKGALDLATDAMMGALNGVTFGLLGGLKGLMGDGYVDIPKHWQSSSASLPRGQYKLILNAPYGNLMTRIMKLFVPFAMIAAGAWPRSLGRESYTGPFLCKLFDTGRCQIPLGMITEFTVQRGTGNLGFNLKGQPLSMEISFTVTDLSSILHMPLTQGAFIKDPTLMDEESTITNYLATVAGQSIENQIYGSHKAVIRSAKFALGIGIISSPAFWAGQIHDTAVNGMYRYIPVVGWAAGGVASATLGILEAGSRNSSVVEARM